jgi:hypothetical protein
MALHATQEGVNDNAVDDGTSIAQWALPAPGYAKRA